MTNKQLGDQDLDHHLRTTLTAVAATVRAEESTSPAARHRRRRIMVGLGALAIAAPVAASAVIGIGPEYVDKIPPDNVIVAGSVDGNRYWMVEMTRKVGCEQPPPGVEFIIEDSNVLGREWNTSGAAYGEPLGSGCRYDTSEALADPALSYSGGRFVGETFVRPYAVHPDVTALRVTIDGSTEEIDVHPVDGAGYAIFEVPPDSAQYTVELLIEDEVVPGSKETRAVPDRSPN
jgi:hypothetical protein